MSAGTLAPATGFPFPASSVTLTMSSSLLAPPVAYTPCDIVMVSDGPADGVSGDGGVGVGDPLEPATTTGLNTLLLLTSSSGSLMPSPESSVQLKLPLFLRA